MPDAFNAYMVNEVDGQYSGSLTKLRLADLPHEKVLIDVSFSSLNYKDGLAVTGKGRIVRKFPMVCGIDLAGTVAASADGRFKAGDKVVVIGSGLSETSWGGYSQRMRVNPDAIIKLPAAFTEKQVMAIGTAGYTAMLCVMALEHEGLQSGQGEVLVTGAAGGVGSAAVAILAKLGYRVVASTGRTETHDYLKFLGAAEVMARSELDRAGKPLDKARWAGAVDSVGGRTLATVLSQTRDDGAVAACGLAGGSDLPTTVMPFILRGVKLLGINYFAAPQARRDGAWKRLATDFDRTKLDAMTVVEPLSDIRALAEKILRGQVRGRVVIDVNS